MDDDEAQKTSILARLRAFQSQYDTMFLIAGDDCTCSPDILDNICDVMRDRMAIPVLRLTIDKMPGDVLLFAQPDTNTLTGAPATVIVSDFLGGFPT